MSCINEWVKLSTSIQFFYFSFCAGVMPISNEQWRVAVGLWVARFQRPLIIRRGVKRASSSQGASSPSSQKEFLMKRKGKKKHKEDSLGNQVITADDLYSGLCDLTQNSKCRDSTDRSRLSPLLELLECTKWTLLLVVIMILLFLSGDIETNPGPMERGR